MNEKIETSCRIVNAGNNDKAKRLFINFDNVLAVPIFAIREISLCHNPKNSKDPWYIVIDIGREQTGDTNPYIQVKGKQKAHKVYMDLLKEIEQFYMSER